MLLEEGVCYDQCVLLAKLLVFALLNFVLQGQICLLPQESLDFLLLHSKAMAPHSSSLVWKIPWMEEPGGLQSMGSLRVGHD